MRYKLLTLILFACTVANAQKKAIKYNNITNIGWLNGSSQNAFTLQTINGIKIDKWQLGLGVGLDNYGTKSIPVFVDVRRTFGLKKWQPLVYADAGVNYTLRWGNFAVKDFNNEYYFDVNNTFYGEFGMGLSTKISKKTSLNITAGFSYKHLSYTEKKHVCVYISECQLITVFIAPKYQKIFLETIESLDSSNRKKATTVEVQLVTASQEKYWYLLNIQKQNTAQANSTFHIFATNIHAFKLREADLIQQIAEKNNNIEALQSAYQVNEAIVNNSNAIIITVDVNNKISGISKFTEALINYIK